MENEEKNKIEVIVIEPEKEPKVVEITDDLKSMQKLVGGWIEEYFPFETDQNIAIICNKEGILSGLPLNRAIRSEYTNEIMEVIAGTFFFSFSPPEEDSFQSMPKEKKEKFLELFKYPELFYRTRNGIEAEKIVPRSRASDAR